MTGLIALYQIIAMITNIFVMLIIIQFVIGLLFAFNVVSQSNQFLMAFYSSINSLISPILEPIRRRMPDTGAIDFSPIVLIVLLNIMLILLASIINA